MTAYPAAHGEPKVRKTLYRIAHIKIAKRGAKPPLHHEGAQQNPGQHGSADRDQVLGCGDKKSGRSRALPIWPLTIAFNGSVDEFFAHHFSVRPLLNGYLAHIERTPFGMIGIDAVNNERLVARSRRKRRSAPL